MGRREILSPKMQDYRMITLYSSAGDVVAGEEAKVSLNRPRSWFWSNLPPGPRGRGRGASVEAATRNTNAPPSGRGRGTGRMTAALSPGLSCNLFSSWPRFHPLRQMPHCPHYARRQVIYRQDVKYYYLSNRRSRFLRNNLLS